MHAHARYQHAPQPQAIHGLREANRVMEADIKDMHTKLVEMGVSPKLETLHPKP